MPMHDDAITYDVALKGQNRLFALLWEHNSPVILIPLIRLSFSSGASFCKVRNNEIATKTDFTAHKRGMAPLSYRGNGYHLINERESMIKVI